MVRRDSVADGEAVHGVKRQKEKTKKKREYNLGVGGLEDTVEAGTTSLSCLTAGATTHARTRGVWGG